MPLQSVVLDGGEFSAEELDQVSEYLLELGALSVSVEDANAGGKDEQPIFDEPDAMSVVRDWNSARSGADKFWKVCTLTALFALDVKVESVVMELGSMFNMRSPPKFRSEPLKDQDWVVKVQSTFQPIKLGRCWISFPWARLEPTWPNVGLTLEPGMAFGTGEHATTRLIVLWLQEYFEDIDQRRLPSSSEHTKLLDYGSGSGVLALFGVLLGAKRVRAVGVEIDGDALAVSKINAESNALAEYAEFCFPHEGTFPDGFFDVTVANILAEPLRTLAPLLSRKTRVGGAIALSGILASQAQGLSDIYTMEGFDMAQAKLDNGWVLLTGTKRRL
ncbi:Ribosomal protein L11 methyltransferase [Porphyridium purpureum]|uniref:ETFB lysine methyltransferase n=1 Tax=Porphyridium purpureum TaxID=35688 RepID=A0A5J4Z6I5_PORPP|nr:Ribosomal protein L11 methyltransferase [Porphyridium purpureum]|eukprot:POR8706..scf295_1